MRKYLTVIIMWSILLFLAVFCSIRLVWLLNHPRPAHASAPSTPATEPPPTFKVHWDRPAFTIIHVLELTNAWLKFPEGNVAICVNPEQWKILMKAYPTNICYDRVEFDKEVPVTYDDKMESNQR